MAEQIPNLYRATEHGTKMTLRYKKKATRGMSEPNLAFVAHALSEFPFQGMEFDFTKKHHSLSHQMFVEHLLRASTVCMSWLWSCMDLHALQPWPRWAKNSGHDQ